MSAMHLRSFILLTRAWMLGITRDRSTIFWTFAFPILFVVIFGFAFGRSDVGSYEIGFAVDQSTPSGRALTEAFGQVPPFKLVTGSMDGLVQKLRNGELYAVISDAPTPATAATPSGTAGPSALQVYYDPSRASAAQIVLPIIRQVVNDADARLSGRQPSLTVAEQSVRSQNLRFIDFFLPGIIGFSIMQAGMFSAIPLVQLRITRVLKRFSATPISRWAVITSQGVTRLLLAVVQTVVLLLVGKLLFNINVSSNFAGMLSFVMLGGMAFLGLGFAVSGLARTEEAVPALVQAVSFPMMFLSGVFWPIENFPGWLQNVSRVLPLTFLGDGLRQVMVGGAPLNPLWLDYLVLTGWVVGAGVLAVRFFKWE